MFGRRWFSIIFSVELVIVAVVVVDVDKRFAASRTKANELGRYARH